MFNFLREYRNRCRNEYMFIFIFLLGIFPVFFSTAIAEQECATDFFSQNTCLSFDSRNATRESADWMTDFGFSGSQIRHRKALDGGWVSSPWNEHNASGNRAIHHWQCITDLFGEIVCDKTDSVVNQLDTIVSD